MWAAAFIEKRKTDIYSFAMFPGIFLSSFKSFGPDVERKTLNSVFEFFLMYAAKPKKNQGVGKTEIQKRL